MGLWIVTRHPGARAWLRRQGLDAEATVDFDPARVGPGDCVVGTLPVHLAADACERGARYLNLVVETPPDHRGVELDADTLERFHARLEEYHIRRVHPDAGRTP